MKITTEDVNRIAALAHLELTAEEQARMQKDLSSILDYIDQLAELDTANMEPMTRTPHIAQIDQAAESLRDDEPRKSLARDAALNSAPQADRGFFRVPKVIHR
jgi:aspartyl-tRNA(Asn)/glutamyl-tRNA(Gln) amidotransferase subunit C